MRDYEFPAHQRFLNRTPELGRLNEWWAGQEANALAIFGRRRVGKSWLLREFAHQKPALILVADSRSLEPQLEDFAELLEPLLGLRPDLPDLASLFKALLELGRSSRILVIIDEFPYLLPNRETEKRAALTGIQKVMEERDRSQLKLILCGSYIGQMEGLLTGPLRGRLSPISIEPLDFLSARAFMPEKVTAVDAIERFAVSGGMSLYLDELCREGPLQERIITRALNPRGPLFNDPRELLEEELRRPGTYYSVLEELAQGKRAVGDLAGAIGTRTGSLQGYLETLVGMRLVRYITPVTEQKGSRRGQYELADDFMKFWFRFVFPYQEDLKSGLEPADLYRLEIEQHLNDHISPTWERLCRQWSLRQGSASRIGGWWGPALNASRRSGERQTEEIDLVGLAGARVKTVGECKWTKAKMPHSVLTGLETYKLPALIQSGAKLPTGGPLIQLFSRSGFDRKLKVAAESRPDIELIGPGEIFDSPS